MSASFQVTCLKASCGLKKSFMAFEHSKFDPAIVGGGGLAGVTTAISFGRSKPGISIFLIEPRMSFVPSPFIA